MFLVAYNKKDKKAYIIKNRCGSTLLANIIESNNYPKLQLSSLPDILDLCKNDDEVEIIITIREPKTTYLSGASVAFFLALDQPDKSRTALITRNSLFLRPILKNWETQLPSYDLNDQHCTHGLWLATTLLCGGYNVKLITMDKWTDHALTYYPKNKTGILARHSDCTLYGRSEDVAEIAEIVSTTFNNMVIVPQQNSNSMYTWEKWLEPEVALFDTLMLYKNDPQKKYLNYALTKLASSEVYWDNTNLHVHDFKSPMTISLIIGQSPSALPDAIVLKMNQLLST